jgi:hypothetical protein
MTKPPIRSLELIQCADFAGLDACCPVCLRDGARMNPPQDPSGHAELFEVRCPPELGGKPWMVAQSCCHHKSKLDGRSVLDWQRATLQRDARQAPRP